MVQMELQVELLCNNARQQNVQMFSQRLNELPFHTECCRLKQTLRFYAKALRVGKKKEKKRGN